MMAAGPGRFGRRAERVREAEQRRAETAGRWRGYYTQLPGERWPDEAVARVATERGRRPPGPPTALLRGRGGQGGRRCSAGRGAHRQA